MNKETKILVTGGSGLVASRFIELYHADYKITAPDLPDFDITSPRSVEQTLADCMPDVILHCAALTDVTKAEEQRGLESGSVWQANVIGTRNMVTLGSKGPHIIHISTDMVFPGSSVDPGPYPENHPPEPDSDKLTWYGFSKGAAERIAAENGATVVRITYPVRSAFAGKSDYLRWPLSQFDSGKLRPAFTDQTLSITFIDELCMALRIIIDKNLSGTFHAASRDTGTPFEIYSYLLAQAREVTNVVTPSSLAKFIADGHSPVRYPHFGGLQVAETEAALGSNIFSPWKQIIDKLVTQWKGV